MLLTLNFKLLTCGRARAERERGFGIIEIIVAVAIISVALFATAQTSALHLKQSIESKKSLKAAYLAKEALEATRSVRDESWATNIATLNAGTPYYPIISGAEWTLSASNPGLVDGAFNRQIITSAVSRDANDDIVSSGGADDPSTKKITATISWESKSVTLTTYLSDLYDN